MKTAVIVLSGAAVFFALVLGGDFGDTVGAPGGIGIQTQAPPPGHHHQGGPPNGGTGTHHGGQGGPTPGQTVPEPTPTEHGPQPSPPTPTGAPSPSPPAIPTKHHRKHVVTKKKSTHAKQANDEKGPKKHKEGGDHEGRRGKAHGSGHGESKHSHDHGHGSCSKDQEDGHDCGHRHAKKD